MSIHARYYHCYPRRSTSSLLPRNTVPLHASYEVLRPVHITFDRLTLINNRRSWRCQLRTADPLSSVTGTLLLPLIVSLPPVGILQSVPHPFPLHIPAKTQALPSMPTERVWCDNCTPPFPVTQNPTASLLGGSEDDHPGSSGGKGRLFDEPEEWSRAL